MNTSGPPKKRWRSVNVDKIEDSQCRQDGGQSMYTRWRSVNVDKIEDSQCRQDGGQSMYTRWRTVNVDYISLNLVPGILATSELFRGPIVSRGRLNIYACMMEKCRETFHKDNRRLAILCVIKGYYHIS